MAATGAGWRPWVVRTSSRRTATRREPGPGLGLEIMQGIVRQRGGILQVEDSSGEETTVRLLLPLSPTHRRPSASPEPAKGALPVGGGS